MALKRSTRKTTAAKKRAPARKTTARKTAARKTATRKTAARRTTTKRSPARKTAAKKRAPAKKTTGRKTTARKTTVKKTTARKATVKKTAAHKTAAKRTTVRKPTAKKTTARKTAAKKTTARKTPARSTSTIRGTAAPSTTEDVTGAGIDAIELLTTDHREVEQLFRQFEAAAPSSEVAKELADKIVRELSVHAVIEEMILYPAAREAVGDAEVDHAIDEHLEVKELLAKVDGKAVDEDEVQATFRRIKLSVEGHVREEETELFPVLRRSLGHVRLQQMGDAMRMAKRVAPTHPHPNAPSTPPGNIVAGLAVSVIDKIRDVARDAVRR